jgi:hypothetical protein
MDPPDERRCTAKSKQTGQRCARWTTPGSQVCYYRGGRTPRGIASPAFRHGRYSKRLTAELLDHYRSATLDPDILALEEEIALLDGRIRSILADLAPVAAWVEDLKGTLLKLDLALGDGDLLKVAENAAALNEVVDSGGDDADRWAEVANLVEQRRKLTQTERKRLVEARQFVPLLEARAVIARLVEGVRAEVDDPTSWRASPCTSTARSGNESPVSGGRVWSQQEKDPGELVCCRRPEAEERPNRILDV